MKIMSVKLHTHLLMRVELKRGRGKEYKSIDMYIDRHVYSKIYLQIYSYVECKVQQAMLEEEEKMIAPTLVPVMSHIK